MKLDKFFDKSPPIKRPSRAPIILQNEAKTDALQEEIDSLTSRLGMQTQLQQERDAAIRRKGAVEEQYSTIQKEFDEINETVKLQEANIAEYEERLTQLPVLQEQLKEQTAKASSHQNELMTVIQQHNQTKNDLESLQNQVVGLIDENSDLHESENKAVADQQSIAQDFKDLKNQFTRIKTFSDENSKIKQELEKELFTTRDERNYWQKEADEAKVQVEQTAIIEDRLRNWISKLEKDESTSRKKSTVATSIVNELKATITEMGNTIDELMKERNYLQQTNAEYRKELAQPRYLSMGSIMAREKFSMPLAKENIRTQYLGNSPPTLLKFKKKSGESNDN